MNPKQKQLVLDIVDIEGFDYCFVNYTAFPEIKDEEFHKLRKAYIEAHNNLKNYLEK